MHLPKFKSGIIHLGILVLAIGLLTLAASASSFAASTEKKINRTLGKIEFYQKRCDNGSQSACRKVASYQRSLTKLQNKLAKESNSAGSTGGSSYVPSPKGPCHPIGDINNDGIVNEADAQAILNHIAGKDSVDPYKDRADVNKDGKIDSVDAKLIKQYLTGSLKTFAACGTSTPAPQGNKISWSTPYASLEASDFYIMVNGKKFTGSGQVRNLHSSPPFQNKMTLEREWIENGVPMRLHLYFSSDSSKWKVYEVRTYNGSSKGDWIYYPGFSGAAIGSTLKTDLIVLNFPPAGPPKPGTPSAEIGVTGTVYFKNLKLQAFMTPTGCASENPKLTLDSYSLKPGAANIARITARADCDGKKVSFENHTDSSTDKWSCILSASTNSSECKIEFKAPQKSTIYGYYFQAGLDLDGNGTYDSWSTGVTLYVK